MNGDRKEGMEGAAVEGSMGGIEQVMDEEMEGGKVKRREARRKKSKE